MEFLENYGGLSIGMLLMNLANKSQFWFDMAQLETRFRQQQPDMAAHRLWPAQLLVYNEKVIIKFELLSMRHRNFTIHKTKYNIIF